MRPPVPKSPIRLRSRHSSSSSTLQTPPGPTNPERRLSGHGDLESKLPIEYSSIFSSEMVETEDAKSRASNLEHLAADSVPVFERGRFYDEYSARRNERLKRKSVGEGTPYSLGVETVTTKRRGTVKKKTTTVETTTTTPRYSLRSMTKENKKPPPLPMNVAVTSAMKSVTNMRGRRRI